MYRILVVDDEVIIADGICDLLQRIKEYEVEVYTAYSGKKALEFMNRYRVDILVSDICMSDLNGLELQKHVIQLWPECKIIFLTGHDDFDYIQQAVRGNSLDYILKSEEDEQIGRAVVNGIKIVENERKQKAMLLKAQNYMQEYLPLLGREYLMQLLQGLKISKSELMSIFYDINLPLNAGRPVILLLGRIEDDNSDTSISNIKLNMNIQHLINNYLATAGICQSYSVTREQLIWFIQPYKTNEDPSVGQEGTDLRQKSVLYIFEMLDVIQQQIQEQFSLTMSFIITESAVLWEDVHTEYDRLDYMLNTNYRFARQIVLINDVLIKGEGTGAALEANELFRAIEKKMDKLEFYLENRRQQEYRELVAEIIGSLEGLDASSHGKLFFILGATLLKMIYKYDLVSDIDKKINIERLVNIGKHTNSRETSQYFSDISFTIFNCMDNANMQQGQNIISNVRNFIGRNLREDLSLTLLADMFHFNSSYFSRLYKAETGQSLSDYILEQRISLAKNLLKEKVKVQEIADAAGFRSASYFINVFKKYTGITPKQYCEKVNNS